MTLDYVVRLEGFRDEEEFKKVWHEENWTLY